MPPFRPTPPRFLQLFALPLSRTPPPNPKSKLPLSTGSNSTPLFYLHAKQKLPSTEDKKELSYVTRATDMAANQWEKLGKAKEGSYKRRIYMAGDKFMDRIEFEEWALKAIDPALGPKPWTSLTEGADGVKKEEDNKKAEEVTLLYPPSLLSPEALQKALQTQLDHRVPHHKSAMRNCLLFAPVTFPFAIIPVIPNLPLFYVLWRAWSHWRAYKSSSYLSTLLTSLPPQIKLTPSKALDEIYASGSGSTGGEKGDQQLLDRGMVERLVEEFELRDEEKHELLRGVAQVEERWKKEKEREKEEEGKKAV